MNNFLYRLVKPVWSPLEWIILVVCYFLNVRFWYALLAVFVAAFVSEFLRGLVSRPRGSV